MEFSAFLIFAVWTSSMTCLTFGKERERAMVFPDYHFFSERRLVNHTIEEKRVKNLDDCELFCYLNDNCVSLNFKKDPDDNGAHICELNNATHLRYDSDLTTDANFYYRGSKNACDKSSQCQNNATCVAGFTLKGYRCSCPPGFEGELCETDINECEGTLGKCHKEAACSNTHGSYVCTCKLGYIGDGLNCTADPCYHYSNLSKANRNKKETGSTEMCDNQLPEGWYRFVGGAGTKMPTKHVPAYRCGTVWSGWLDGVHPTVEDGEVYRTVCFSNRPSYEPLCKYSTRISVKNCGSYLIYRLHYPPQCDSRYCGTD